MAERGHGNRKLLKIHLDVVNRRRYGSLAQEIRTLFKCFEEDMNCTYINLC